MKQNVIGKILFYLGIAVIVIGIIQGFINANQMFYQDSFGNQETRFEWRFFIQMAVQATVDGMVLIGISEVIKLLQNANGKIAGLKLFNGKEKSNHQTEIINEEVELPTVWKLSEDDIEKVYKLYSDAAIIELLPSQLEGYCVVKLQKDEGAFIKVVDVNGFHAQEVQNSDIKKKVTEWYNERV